MKTLVNCTPEEFLVQTNKIRKSVWKWLTDTDVLNIRRRMPEYEKADTNASIEDRKKVLEHNKELERQQTKENLSAILDAMLEDHPKETLEVIALCCFIEPKDINNYAVRDILTSIAELLNDEVVISFFTSLARLGNLNTARA